MQDETKRIEEELLALQQNAKKEIAEIANINLFSEKVYSLILTTLIKVEQEHVKIYNNDPSNILGHSSITFSVANASNECDIFSLIELNSISNLPSTLEFDKMVTEFNNDFLEIVKECNANSRLQNFVLPGISINTFFNVVAMQLNKNTKLASVASTKARDVNTITISLNLTN